MDASARGSTREVLQTSKRTELDAWQCIAEEAMEVPSIYFASEREAPR
jgi:hypothetical protein